MTTHYEDVAAGDSSQLQALCSAGRDLVGIVFFWSVPLRMSAILPTESVDALMPTVGAFLLATFDPIAGLPQPVAQVGDAFALDHCRLAESGRDCRHPIGEQSYALAKQNWDQVDSQLIKHSGGETLPSDVGRTDEDDAVASDATGLRHGMLDTVGDKRERDTLAGPSIRH